MLQSFADAKENETELLPLVEGANNALTSALGSWETPAERRIAAEKDAASAKTATLGRLHTRSKAVVRTMRGLLANPSAKAIPDHQNAPSQHHQQAAEDERGREDGEGRGGEADEEEGYAEQVAVGKDASLSECGIFEGVWEQHHEHEDLDDAMGEQRGKQPEEEFVDTPVHGRGAFSRKSRVFVLPL